MKRLRDTSELDEPDLKKSKIIQRLDFKTNKTLVLDFIKLIKDGFNNFKN